MGYWPGSRCLWRRAQARLDELSGGNVQRVLLARELTVGAKVIIGLLSDPGLGCLCPPNRPVELLTSHRDNGGAVVLVSEDLDELIAIGDRIVVMRDGQLAGEFQPRHESLEEIGLLMTGH